MTGPVLSRARPGRVVIGTLGLDQHEVGAMAISQLLVRHGYEVIYLGRLAPEQHVSVLATKPLPTRFSRSEERRVGKECPVLCRSRWSPYH